MNCPYCGADITETIDDYINSVNRGLDFIFVCPQCKKALGVRTGNHKKTEKLC